MEIQDCIIKYNPSDAKSCIIYVYLIQNLLLLVLLSWRYHLGIRENSNQIKIRLGNPLRRFQL